MLADFNDSWRRLTISGVNQSLHASIYIGNLLA